MHYRAWTPLCLFLSREIPPVNRAATHSTERNQSVLGVMSDKTVSDGSRAGADAIPGAGGARASGAVPPGTVAQLRAAWERLAPTRKDYGKVVTELNALKLVGEGSVFERGSHVPITHMGYFKPPADAFLADLRLKDRRSAKEWEYVNAAGAWTDVAMVAMEVARMESSTMEDVARRLILAEKAMKAVREVLLMRAQYFRDITEQGVEMARQMAFLVEQGNDAVFSEAYRTARDTLTTKMEVEAAKQLAKARLEKGARTTGGQAGAAGSE